MSYYILPKNINTINVNPSCSYELCNSYVSLSLLHYYNKVKKQIEDLSYNIFEDAIKIINPYEFIFSTVPGSKYSVSKLKPKTNLFYDLLEIYNNLNIFLPYASSNISSLHISKYNNDSLDCFEMIRENFNDEIYCYNNDRNNNNFIEDEIIRKKFDYIFYDTNDLVNNNDYFLSIIESLLLVLRNQNYKGVSIIKISETFHKPVIDALYFLTSLYEKVYVCKPSTNNVTSYEKYIVCKNFLHNETSNIYLKVNFLKLLIFSKKIDNKNVTHILDFELPYYFKNKIDDINIIIGQQQLESFDQIINIYNNKNKDDKIETAKKNNIQKSVSWCEKYKIPCNKFTEKINIFLPINNEII